MCQATVLRTIRRVRSTPELADASGASRAHLVRIWAHLRAPVGSRSAISLFGAIYHGVPNAKLTKLAAHLCDLHLHDVQLLQPPPSVLDLLPISLRPRISMELLCLLEGTVELQLDHLDEALARRIDLLTCIVVAHLYLDKLFELVQDLCYHLDAVLPPIFEALREVAQLIFKETWA